MPNEKQNRFGNINKPLNTSGYYYYFHLNCGTNTIESMNITMPKQMGLSRSVDSIVYTRTCDVIATPMCNCLCMYWPRRIVWRPIHGRSARQRPLRIVHLILDLDVAPTAITAVLNTDVASHRISLGLFGNNQVNNCAGDAGDDYTR